MVIKKWHCGCLSFTSDCIFKPKVLELQNMGMGQTCVTIRTDVLSKEECELTTLNQRCVYKGLNTFKNTLQRRNLEKRINVQVVHYHPSDRQALFSYDSRFHVDLGLDGDYNRILSPTIVPNYDKESLQNELAYLKHLHANDPDLFNKIKDEAMGIVPPNIYVGLLNAYVTENKKETTSAAGTKPTKPPPSNATTPTKPAVSASLAGDTIWADPDDTAMPPDDAKSTVTPSTASKDDAPINDDDTKIVLAEEGEGVSTESVELEKDATKPIKNNDQTTLKGGTKPSSETKEGRNMPVESTLGKVVEDAAASEHEEGGICKGGYDDDTTKQPSTTMISRGGTFDQLNTAKSDVEMAAASKAVEPPTQSKESSFNNGIAGGGGGKLRGKDLSSHPEMREASHVLLDIAGGNAKVANIKQTAQRISPRRQKRSRGSEHNSAGDNGNGRPKRQAAMNRKCETNALLKKLPNAPSSVHHKEESAWRFYNPAFLKDSVEQLTTKIVEGDATPAIHNNKPIIRRSTRLSTTVTNGNNKQDCNAAKPHVSGRRSARIASKCSSSDNSSTRSYIEKTMEMISNPSENETIVKIIQQDNNNKKELIHVQYDKSRSYSIPNLIGGSEIKVLHSIINENDRLKLVEEVISHGNWRRYYSGACVEPRIHFLASDDANNNNMESEGHGYGYASTRMRAQTWAGLPLLKQFAGRMAEICEYGEWTIGVDSILYNGSSSSIGYHADNNQGEEVIACVVLSDTSDSMREVRFRTKTSKEEVARIRVACGDGYVMNKNTQQNYEHRVAKSEEIGQRLVVVLRRGDKRLVKRDNGQHVNVDDMLGPRRNVFGDIKGVEIGSTYRRCQLIELELHIADRKAISGNKPEGASAIILSRNDSKKGECDGKFALIC